MTIKLNQGERLDDLQRNGYRIIQNTDIFCFGTDAVLLSAFATVRQDDKVLDLGCGNGIIPILMKARNDQIPDCILRDWRYRILMLTWPVEVWN